MEHESTVFENCNFGFSPTSFCIHTPSRDAAFSMIQGSRLAIVAEQARRFDLAETLIYYPDCDQPLQIPSGMAKPKEELKFDLGDYSKVWEHLQAEQSAGKIVIITSNVTRDKQGRPTSTPNPVKGRDFCYNTSSNLLPSRAAWSSDRWTGYNYRLSWRRDRHDFRRLSSDYERLKELLEIEDFIPNYHYRLYRPPTDDEITGALCEYSTTYYRVRLPWYNDEVRIGVSDPNDWRIIEEGQKRETLVSSQ